MRKALPLAHPDPLQQLPAPVIILSGPAATITFANQHFHKLWPNRSFIGKPLGKALPKETATSWFKHVQEAQKTQQTAYDHYPLTISSVGQEDEHYSFTFQPYIQADAADSVLALGVNVSAQVRAQQQSKVIEDRYQAFIRNSTEGIWRFELEQPLRVTLSVKAQIKHMYTYAYLAEANQAMAAMYRLDGVDHILGARLGDFLIEQDPQNIAYLTAFVESGYSLAGNESHEIDAEGNDKYFRNSLVGLVKDGYLIRAWGTQQDITAERQAIAALHSSEERLSLALEASQTGIWEWDIVNDKLTWSPQLKKIYGLPHNYKITYPRYQRLIHPEDRSRLIDIVRHAMLSGEPYTFEHRIIWPDKTLHWVLGHGQAFIKNGKPVRMIGTSMIIDKRKRVDELEAINQQLQLQREELMALNNSKDEFISLASHQLRTPATGVKQYIGMLLEGYGGDLLPDQIRMLKTAYESNERQLNIIDDLLRVAHVDAGKVTLKKQPVNLVTLLREVIDEQADTFKRKNQTVVFDHNQRSLTVPIDPDRMRMVVENILDNAGKYTGTHKQITITLEHTTTHVTISIHDQGVGIAKKDLPRLFQKFSRVSNSLSTLVGGTGLGLYWAEKIVHLHDGTIEVSSKLNHGSTFTIKIPRK